MTNDLYAVSGLIAPISTYYDYLAYLRGDDIRPNNVAPTWRNRTLRGRLKNFFAWSPDWGCKMVGGPIPKMRDMLPVFRTVRGGLRFDTSKGASC